MQMSTAKVVFRVEGHKGECTAVLKESNVCGHSILNVPNHTQKIQTKLLCGSHLLSFEQLHNGYHIHSQCPELPVEIQGLLYVQGIQGHPELCFMYEEAFRQMSKVIKSLNVKTATKPRSDPSVSAEEKESAHSE